MGGAVSLSLEIRRPALLPETMAAYPASLRVEHLLTEYRFEVRRDTHTPAARPGRFTCRPHIDLPDLTDLRFRHLR